MRRAAGWEEAAPKGGGELVGTGAPRPRRIEGGLISAVHGGILRREGEEAGRWGLRGRR